ncbi:MAG TPA: DUF1289 domain-containing protein [Casimicrobiaceae bacterium]|nr:DUF1289 domain-containing protein [Casimicrobiaceae bacterium]
MSAAGPLSEVASPCNSVCTIDQVTGYCAGCYRTLDEIAGWMDLSSEARRMLLAELDERRQRYGAAIEQRSAAHARR